MLGLHFQWKRSLLRRRGQEKVYIIFKFQITTGTPRYHSVITPSSRSLPRSMIWWIWSMTFCSGQYAEKICGKGLSSTKFLRILGFKRGSENHGNGYKFRPRALAAETKCLLLFFYIFNDSDSDPTCLSSGLLNASLPVWILIPMLIPTESAWRIPSGNRQRR